MIVFIPSLLQHDMDTFYTKLGIVLILWLLIIAASGVDLITGIQASRRTGTKKTTSWGLRKTVSKLLQYFGILFMFLFVDFGASALSEYLTVFEMPICSCLGVTCIIIIETLSVKENLQRGKTKDDDKIDDMASIAASLIKAIPNDTLNKIADAIAEAKTKGDKQ